MPSVPPFTQFINSHFSQSNLNEAHKYTKAIMEIRPGSQHIPMVNFSFPVLLFLEEKGIKVETNPDETIYLYVVKPPENKATRETICGIHKFSYGDISYTAYQIEMPPPENRGPPSMFWDFVYDPPAGAESPDSFGRKFIEDVHAWMEGVEGEYIWVYDNGCWTQDTELAKAIKSSNWNTLVLDERFITGLKRDTNTFFSSEKIYKSLEITWKRGILLLGMCKSLGHFLVSHHPGPPGNGKTETIKALLNDTSQVALYVKSFSTMAVSICFLCTIWSLSTL